MLIDIRHNLPQVGRAIDEIGKQARFAGSRALNAVAAEAIPAEQNTMEQRFDRPTAYTVNSLRFEPARRENLTATILPKDGGGSGQRSAEKWLAIGVGGGVRRSTGMELALRAVGILPAGRFVVPAAGAELDANGNWKRSQLTRILLDLRASASATPSRRLNALRDRDAAKGSRKLSRYFVLREHNKGLKPGIYERRASAFGQGVRPVVLFSRSAPRYKAILPFGQATQEVVGKRFAAHFDRELEAALRTAR